MGLIALADDLPRPIAYVLAGGASYGSVQLGQIQALGGTDIRPDFVIGTSVGALNGAVLAEEPDDAYEHLASLWSSVTREDVFGTVLANALSVATRKVSATDDSGLTRIIEGALTSRTFDDLELPFTAMATDFDTGQAVSMTEGDLLPALLASAAIPLVFPPVARKGRTLVDGGLVANVPIGIAAAQGARTIVVLDCGFTVLPPEREDTYTSRLLRTAAIMAAQQVRRDLEQLDGQVVLYLPGPWPIKSRPDDFRRSNSLAAQSYGLSQAWLKSVRIDGPGRYGTAPTDLLVKKAPLPRTASVDPTAPDAELESLVDGVKDLKTLAEPVEAAPTSVAEETVEE